MKVTEAMERFTGRFIPAGLRASDSLAYHRALLVLAFTMSAMVWAPLFAILHYFVLDKPIMGHLCLFAVVHGFLVLGVLRWTGSFVLAGHLLSAVVLLNVSIFAWMTGGFEAPTLLWGPVVPMVATLLAGRRAGLIWTLVFIAEAVVLFALERAYGRWPSQLDANATQITMLMSMIGVLTLAFSLCYCYEAIQRRITDELAAEQQTMKQLLSAQEIERQLLAYDIHDGIVQMMTGAAMHVDAGLARLESAEPGATAEMEIARQLLANSIREARRLVSGLRPPILDECGLVAGIEYLIAEHPGLKVRFEHDADMTRLSPLIETALFRICQESLTNAAKYSAANLVEIHLMRRAGKLSLVVRDDGKGFSANTPEDDLRFGLQGIRQRARFLGGQADIKSQQGTGTTISVQVPIGAE